MATCVITFTSFLRVTHEQNCRGVLGPGDPVQASKQDGLLVIIYPVKDKGLRVHRSVRSKPAQDVLQNTEITLITTLKLFSEYINTLTAVL